ncbi:MAG: type II secretion system protein [Streptosporangiales bacterium]|nr:type II secretion system protein [Streptosporangiales bacterium]
MLAEILAVASAAGCGWLLVAPGAARRRLGFIGAGVHRPRPRVMPAAARPPAWLTDRLRGAAVERVRGAAAIELCEGIAAELRAGRTPAEALRRASEATEPRLLADLGPALAAARAGEDVSAALCGAGSRAGSRRGAASALRRLGICWRVGAESGGAFAPAVERLAAALRDEESAGREVAAQLAGARAAARLLAALPFLGLLLALGLGVDPLAFWFDTPVGFGCLVLGLALDILGLLWMRRLGRAAEVVR